MFGADITAERGVPAERLGEQAAGALNAEIASGTTLDIHAGDQLLIYITLARGVSRFRVREPSSHARTTLWLLEQLLPVQYRVTQHETPVGVELNSSLPAPSWAAVTRAADER